MCFCSPKQSNLKCLTFLVFVSTTKHTFMFVSTKILFCLGKENNYIFLLAETKPKIFFCLGKSVCTSVISLGCNTGLVSVPFPPLLTGVWVGIILLFKWAAIGENTWTIFHGGGSKLCYKIFYIPGI